jgi:hypothetical protein
MSAEYPNSGLLLTNKFKEEENHPDLKGHLDLDKDMLLSMIEKAEGQAEIQIKIKAYLKKDKNGSRMVSMKIDNYEKKTASKAPLKDPWDE